MNSNEKVRLGQFFTKSSSWLKPQVENFILSSNCSIAYDPFAGEGDILKLCKKRLNFKGIKGLDIDSKLSWQINDSLLNIPKIKNSIIVTNPPYIAKQSATRKHLNLTKYFNLSSYDDIYLIALDKMLEVSDYVVAIIPESFINSNYKKKNRLSSITILEENPFQDTQNPVCVACFDKEEKSFDRVKIYKNELFVDYYSNLLSLKLEPSNFIDVKFNDRKGWLALRAVDSSDSKNKIKFALKEDINYDWQNNIKSTSRHFSLISVDVPMPWRDYFIVVCNEILQDLRLSSSDVILTAFKGNTNIGLRRRRLDFKLARAIIEKAYLEIFTNNEKQFRVL